MLERRFEPAAELAGGLDHRARRGDDLVERRVGEQTRDGQRQLRQDLGAVDDHDPAAAVRKPAHGRRHRRVVHPDDDDVVCIVCHG